MKLHRYCGLAVIGIWSLWVGATGSTAGPPESPIANMAWLAGCWENVAGERRIEEQWMRPRGGTMLGMNRTVTGDTPRAFEYLQIREEQGGLVFTARPSKQAEASFRSILITRSKVVFENAEHDFPQRIIYMRGEDGSLVARIEGERAGKPSGVDFPMRRVMCADGAGKPAQDTETVAACRGLAEKECRSDLRCEAIPYWGESLVPCVEDERGFSENCPYEGCRARDAECPSLQRLAEDCPNDCPYNRFAIDADSGCRTCSCAD